MNFEHPFIEKTAMRSRYRQILLERVLPVAAMSGAAVGIPLAVSGAVSGIQSVRRANRIEDSYKQMYEENPNLQAYRDNGQEEMVRKHFEVLKAFAPDVASNPIAASSMVQNMVEQSSQLGTVAPAAIQLPIDMQAKLRSPASNQPPWLVNATTAAMSGLKTAIGPGDLARLDIE